MKRDFELIRKILLDVESHVSNSVWDTTPIILEYAEYDPCIVNEHIYLLISANLLEGKCDPSIGVPVRQAIIFRLTWEGHEFISSAKNENVWNKSFEIIKNKGGTISFDLLKELLLSGAKGLFNL